MIKHGDWCSVMLIGWKCATLMLNLIDWWSLMSINAYWWSFKCSTLYIDAQVSVCARKDLGWAQRQDRQRKEVLPQHHRRPAIGAGCEMAGHREITVQNQWSCHENQWNDHQNHRENQRNDMKWPCLIVVLFYEPKVHSMPPVSQGEKCYWSFRGTRHSWTQLLIGEDWKFQLWTSESWEDDCRTETALIWDHCL